MEKTREFQKNIYFCLFDYVKAFDCVHHNRLWKILKVMVVPDHLTCLLSNLYAGQEVIVRTGYATQTSSKLGKECLFIYFFNWERSALMQSIVTLLIQFICRVNHMN